MFRLLKQLFNTKEGPFTVVFLKEDGPDPSSKYTCRPAILWALCIGTAFIIVGTMIVLFMFTPLGGFAYNQKEIHESVVAIRHKVEAMQDTINARNKQLAQMRNVMALDSDVILTENNVPEQDEQAATETDADDRNVSNGQTGRSSLTPAQKDTGLSITDNMLLVSNLLKNPPEFPISYPLEGTRSRGFNSEEGHFGLDIAAEDGSSFTVIADGVIISQEWTMNYGYVIVVQHGHHLVSVYKHANTIKHTVGDMVLRGDILGTIGDVGIISSGPHLHLEIWNGGVPQNPQHFFINT